jgi:iron complex outermembrane receptor protein
MKSSIKKIAVVLLMTLSYKITEAQDTLFNKELPLKDVVVTAFNARIKWKETPAAISILNKQAFMQFSPASILPALNLVAGVRMEERSPGSYRLSVRGSLLRSPFGIRNVKVYWNNIPFSDATGNTYLNLIDPSIIDQVEVAKGPASSMYGAGTGGVFLLKQDISFSEEQKQAASLVLTGGSFGYNQQQIHLIKSTPHFTSRLQLHRLQSDGYREQSNLNRTGIAWHTGYKLAKHVMKAGVFYTQLHYQTPGGITAAQMLANPRLSRQATPTLPSAIEQKAAIQNNTIWLGVQDNYQINEQQLITSFVTFNQTNFTNPFITNYEKRIELNLAAGIQWILQPKSNFNKWQWIIGTEYLVNESAIKNYANNKGVAGPIQADDIVYTRQGFLFTQWSYKPTQKLLLNAGLSLNQQLYEFKSLLLMNQPLMNRKIQSPISPRLTLNYKLNANLNIYGIIARGFSAPSLAEIRPSDGNFYPQLNAEQGWNAEIGIKGGLLNDQIQVDLSYYSFQLKNAIVRRNDLNGNEYFINAGATKQNGLEAMIKYLLVRPSKEKKYSLDFTNSFSFQPYRFTNYQQGNTVFNGNPITGVPKYIWVSTINFAHKNGWTFNITANLTSKISLNDAATVYAEGYELLQTKLAKQIKWKQYQFQLFAGADNLLNQTFSLGNDINAVGNRYFNPAPLRNGYMGIRINLQ